MYILSKIIFRIFPRFSVCILKNAKKKSRTLFTLKMEVAIVLSNKLGVPKSFQENLAENAFWWPFWQVFV